MDTPPPRAQQVADSFRTIGALSTVGFSFVLAVGLGALCGYYLDKWLGTSPWLFFLFILFGLAAGSSTCTGRLIVS